MNKEKTAVIGGGLGGLAAACTLAARGHAVTLFERNEWAGGKAAVLEKDGFRFDMGPTILTIPSVLRRIYAEAGKKLEEHLDLVELDPQWRCFFSDGNKLDLTKGVEAMGQTLNEFTGNPQAAEEYNRFIDWSRDLHGISDRFFFWKPVGGIMDVFRSSGMVNRSLLQDLLKMRMGQTVASSIRSFIGDERAAQMIDHFTQYVGSSPDASPAILCGIAHMQTSEGVWYPMGGTRAVPVALEKLARELGVEFRLGTKVEKIAHDGKRVTGVITADGRTTAFQRVVSNCDSVRTFRELIGGPLSIDFDKARPYEPACSGVVLYLGLNKRYDELLHHNFVFSRDPDEEFHAIYEDGEPAPDPTCYVCAPAVTEPAVAPAGGEALYILVHTPYLRPNQDWSKMLPGYRQIILDKLKSTAGLSDIEDRIVSESHLTPRDIHNRYHVLNGAIYGLASHGTFRGAFKPNNRRKELQGLYLCGGAAHPGPGMPMVLMSGWIAADALDKDQPAEAAA
ncbi:MAG: phytoene desaturase [Verrucomicrobia bacterium]|nr:phytoene desaturase [Verrucomicrobiota bacterium]